MDNGLSEFLQAKCAEIRKVEFDESEQFSLGQIIDGLETVKD